MDEREVVTCFLRNDGQLLLVRRSDDAESYPGQWGAITGYLAPERGAPPDEPGTAARREIREETGLDDPALVRRGEPFAVEDAHRGTRWRVHPFLFETGTREIDPNWELQAYEWAHATEIRRRETVPDLWRSYDGVRPTVESVAADDEHGSAWLSVRALEVLRDEAALTADFETVAGVARALLAARPSMAVVENRINRAMSEASERVPGAVERAAREGITSAVEADRAAAAVAAARIEGARVCTLSRSGTVEQALDLADPEAVLIAESRPGGEGVAVAESLAARHSVTLTSDAALAGQLNAFGADAVVVGADTIFPDRVLNKVGTYGLALAAAAREIPLYVVASADKVAPDDGIDTEPAAATLYDGDADLTVANPLFEATPAALCTATCTERGALETDDVAEVAARHRSLREW
ncbi:Translation initiation factor 2B subunit, eIF-2Balpha/beta/delta family [Halapricum desulfuricans]|uniref:Translation initiation factor 2B subunit, eIF-2Balpha/beta/delta family n=1 Tax=Halapricum desulfuricans TaxID=2841257 RepID=A0A897NKW7_9EURY|nr:NUDIX domain-containing protein [Halapricum desulfuricans]QSG13074.1 Translation initiation factor 2B subunit, eIF-2Balpha/beta/delta family [Halapricum desulfuricans]